MPINHVTSTLLLSKLPNPTASADLHYSTADGQESHYQAKTIRKNNYVTAEVNTPHESFGNVSLQGTLSPTGTNTNTLQGKLFRNAVMYDVSGTVNFEDDIPIEADLTFTPIHRNGQESVLTYSLTNPTSGYGKQVKVKVAEGSRSVEIKSALSLFSKVNWKFVFGVWSSGDKLCNMETSILPMNDGQIHSQLSLNTPWKHLGIDNIKATSDLNLRPTSGDYQYSVQLPQLLSESSFSWVWIPLQHMETNIDTQIKPLGQPTREYQASLKYKDNNAHKSPKTNDRTHLQLGVHLNLDSRWQLQSNASVRKVPNEMGASMNVRLPGEVADTHKASCQYRGNLGDSTDSMDVTYDLLYETDESQRRIASRGQYRNVTDLQAAVRVEWGHDVKYEAAEVNAQMLRKDMRREFSARVATPLHAEDTLTARGSYDVRDASNLIT